MKKIIIILSILTLLLISFNIYNSIYFYSKEKMSDTRTKIKFKNSSIEVDNVLLYYTEEFIKEANKYTNFDNLSYNFEGVYIERTPLNVLGLTRTLKNGTSYILISPANVTGNKLKIILFHELGHYFLNKEHCHKNCNEIMSAEIGESNWYNNWEQQKETFFKNKKH